MIDKPIPLALSLVRMELRNAIDTNTTEIMMPSKSIIPLTEAGA